MEISGPKFGMYDAKYLSVTQRDKPQTVKPNVFREVDESVGKALQLTQDLVALSPEAREFMRLLKKYGKDSPQMQQFLQGKNVDKLVYSYKELLDAVYRKDQDDQEEEEEEDTAQGRKKKQKRPAMPNSMVLQFTSGERSARGRTQSWSRARELLDKMIVFDPDESIRRMLIRELEVLGEEIISAVRQFGVHIIILPRNQNLTQIRIKGMSVVAPGQKSFDGRPWEMVRGLYDISRRIMVIGQENIGNPRHSTAIHEFAHAFDHTFSEKNQRRLPLSVQLWNLFRQEREGLITDYAGTNPQEYFAESVEAYFGTTARDELEKKDPKMFSYLENLFGPQ